MKKRRRESETIRVSNKEELDDAFDRGYQTIRVVGRLAGQIYKTRKLAQLSPLALGSLAASVGAAPPTGGVSLVGVIPPTIGTGLSFGAIILAASIGLSLLIALYKNYEIVEYTNGTLTLHRKD